MTTPKTRQFCETSFKNGKLSAELTTSYQCVLRFFRSTCLKYCACHEKVMPGQMKCCACHAKSSSQNLRSDAPKCNPSQEISARTSSHHVSCTALATENASWQILFKCPTPAIVFETCYKTLTFRPPLNKVHNPARPPRETTSERPKVRRTRQFFTLLTSTCASRHNSVHVFDITTSKCPNTVCYVYFDLDMCFAPQRRALFHLSAGQLAPHPTL